jgi:hypothetical protein
MRVFREKRKPPMSAVWKNNSSGISSQKSRTAAAPAVFELCHERPGGIAAGSEATC